MFFVKAEGTKKMVQPNSFEESYIFIFDKEWLVMFNYAYNSLI